MNISELIEDLQRVQQEHGDLEVRVWADHGQQCMSAWAVGTQWVDEDNETVADEDLNNPEEELCKEDYTLVLEIAG